MRAGCRASALFFLFNAYWLGHDLSFNINGSAAQAARNTKRGLTQPSLPVIESGVLRTSGGQCCY
jgi:hypothetical protein